MSRKFDSGGEARLVKDMLGPIIDEAFSQLSRAERDLILPLIRGREIDDKWMKRLANKRGLSPEEVEGCIAAVLIKLRQFLKEYLVVQAFLDNCDDA
jgi:hypothetical protein